MRNDFDRLWPLLEAALDEHPGTYTKDDLWNEIDAGRAQFWPMPNAAVVTAIRTFPTGLRELRGWLAAGSLEEIAALEPFVCGWAKENGCKRFVLTGRRGWKRVFPGFREKMVFLSKEL